MKKSKQRILEAIIVIFIFVIVFGVALRPYNQRVFIGSHFPPKSGASKQSVVQRMGVPTGVTNTVPVLSFISNKNIIDSLNNLPVSYFIYWRRKPANLELFFELKRRPYRTMVVAFGKDDKVIRGFWGHSYWPDKVEEVKVD